MAGCRLGRCLAGGQTRSAREHHAIPAVSPESGALAGVIVSWDSSRFRTVTKALRTRPPSNRIVMDPTCRRCEPAAASWREAELGRNAHHNFSLVVRDREIGRLDREPG